MKFEIEIFTIEDEFILPVHVGLGWSAFTKLYTLAFKYFQINIANLD